MAQSGSEIDATRPFGRIIEAGQKPGWETDLGGVKEPAAPGIVVDVSAGRAHRRCSEDDRRTRQRQPAVSAVSRLDTWTSIKLLIKGRDRRGKAGEL